jgi:DNA repair protein RecO (recombination protein O)
MPASEHSLKAESIVLRHNDWGEADRLLVVFTREKGKIRAIAKGVRKLTSRKAGHLEPFTHVHLQFSRGRDFWIVTQADTIDAFVHIREDLLLTSYAAYAIELIERFTFEEQENHNLFQLLADTLKRIDAGMDPFLTIRFLEIKLLDAAGYRPQLFKCVECDKDIQPEDQYFTAERGGVICPRCPREQISNMPISMDALKYIRHLQRSEWRSVQKMTIPAQIQPEMETILQYYVTYLLERKLNSPDFLHLMQRGKMNRRLEK